MFDAAAETYRSMGNARGRALVQSNAAWMRHSRLGRDVEAEAALTEALETYEAIGDKRGIAQCVGVMASIKARRRLYLDAWDSFGRAAALAKDVQDLWLEAQILREHGFERLHAGQPSVALDLSIQAESIAEQTGLADLMVGIRSLKGRALLTLGRSDEALQATTMAVRALHPGLELAHLVHHAHGLSLHAVGRHADSHAQFTKAYEVLMGIVSTLDPDDQQLAIKAVPDHASIIEWWQSERPVAKTITVASLGAPTGRPLTANELVSVTLTVSSPEDLDIVDKVDRRQQRLQRVLREATEQRGSLTVGDLSEVLGASEATVRRDLMTIRADGHNIATRGSRSPV
jgi:tetratricopeptide (TPR) repeat protein